MIHTLTTSGALYRINRDRGAMMLAREKRIAFLRCFGIAVCITITILLCIYAK